MFQVHKKAVQITVIAAVFSVAILSLFSYIINPANIFLLLLKIFILTATTIFYFEFFNMGYSLNEAFSLKREYEQLKVSFVLGFVSLVLVAGVYYLTGSPFLMGLTQGLFGGEGTAKGTYFLLVFLSVALLSLAEELFFRAFVFLNLYTKNKKGLAYSLSCLFSVIYYLSLFKGVLPEANLFFPAVVVAFISFVLCFLSTRHQNIYHAVTIHLFVNVALATIGYLILF